MLKSASILVERRKTLLAQSVISKKELEESEWGLTVAQNKVSDTHRWITDSDYLDAEAKTTLAKKQADYAKTDWMATAKAVLRARNRQARLAGLERRASPTISTEVEVIKL